MFMSLNVFVSSSFRMHCSWSKKVESLRLTRLDASIACGSWNLLLRCAPHCSDTSISSTALTY